MGWGKRFLLGDIGLGLDIDDLGSQLQNMQSRLTKSRAENFDAWERTNALEQEVAQLKLCVIALVELLKQKGVVQTQELAALAEAIDAMDGQRDGKTSKDLPTKQ